MTPETIHHLLHGVPRLYSNHPALRCARFQLIQEGNDYLIPSGATAIVLRDRVRSVRGWVDRWEREHGGEKLKPMRWVVACGDFPMWYTAVFEPLIWFQRAKPVPVVKCTGTLKQQVFVGHGIYEPVKLCGRPIPAGEDESCCYCGRPLCRFCRKTSGSDRPVCVACEEDIGRFLTDGRLSRRRKR